MKVSVIISTYSLERLNDLLELLEGLEKQTYKNFETIVTIDENSKYCDVVREKNRCNQNVKLIFNETNRGLAYSRNLGVKYAEGEIVAFIDDDALPYPNWLEEIVNTYEEDEKVGGVTGEIVPLWENDSMSWFPKELWWIISCSYVAIPMKQEVRNGIGTNMSFKKKIAEDVGLFNTNLGKKGEKWILSEEVELCIRLREKTGKKIIYNPDVKVKHKVYPYRLKIRNILKRAFYDGYSKALLKSLYKSDVLSPEKSFLKQLLFKFYPRSFKKIIFEPIKTLKELFIVTMVIVAEGSGYLSFITRNINANRK